MQHDSKKVSSFLLLAQAGTKEAVTGNKGKDMKVVNADSEPVAGKHHMVDKGKEVVVVNADPQPDIGQYLMVNKGKEVLVINADPNPDTEKHVKVDSVKRGFSPTPHISS